MKYEYYQSAKNEKWYWRLKASNGEIIADGGQGYGDVDGCLHGIGLVKKSADAKVIKTDD
ncbi:MAG: YegP family protein [Rhodospirillaceae bacterium]|nr:YegP family protein [Rhodospirillaceae bacterium]